MSVTECVCGFFVLLVLVISHVHSAKILGVFTFPSISHQIVFQPIWKELSLRGHQVTVLAPNPLKDPSLVNLTEIDLSFTYQKMEQFKETMSQGVDHWTILGNMVKIVLNITVHVLENKEVQNFLKNNVTSYDIIIGEIIDPKTHAFAAKCKCPLIGVASLSVSTATHLAVGNPIHPVLHPHVLTPFYGGNLSFVEKIDAVLFDLYQKFAYNYKYIPAVNSLINKYLGTQSFDLRNIDRNMSMLFLNTNPIIHGVRPYGPNVIEFGGGIHIKPPKSLPPEIQAYLDNATAGVIYFSLGSNVKSIYLPQEKKDILIRTFAKLPYKILWKFEDDQLENKPRNVQINKWLPQQDLLRHPNIKLFITQAGLQSTEEALLNGVPLLALPFMADQHFNAKSIVKLEVGRQLDFQTLSDENFSESILEILRNSKYKKNAVAIGKLIKDQPMTGLDKVVWWTEYVIRNKGASYLRNPRADVTWAEFLMLDVIMFLLSILMIMLMVFYKVTQCIIHLLYRPTLKKKAE